MRKKILVLAGLISMAISSVPKASKADLFGGDVVVLSQILVQTIQQLAQLKQILNAGRDNIALIQDINRGINDSLNLFKTISPHSDPGLYREWARVSDALRGLESLYGIIRPSPEARIQKDMDQSVAEAVALNNSIYSYTKEIDEVGERIKSYSHSVSPGGAQKLTAQSLGVMIHVLNQTLRAQATGLKLQAQSLALTNHKDKVMTEAWLANSDTLKAALKNESPEFKLPRF